ncbi:MAG: helix-turn-helix transcriptional regulator [Leptolyngbya sp. SIO1E4]|nr:helix-turn-helix transcriptional regulator [Leptolyngbya sp. SIO1E4]
MTITLSQRDYWDLVNASRCTHQSLAVQPFETIIPYPEQLGRGSHRFIQLREGVGLRISHFQLHTEDVEMVSPERSHPFEYYFCLSGRVYGQEVVAAGQYYLNGSGMAPAEVTGDSADEPILSVNVHIEPFALKTFLGETFDFTSGGLSHLIRPNDRLYYQRLGVSTMAMQAALHQILNCPFDGITKKAYLESKVWELMALLIDQELQQPAVKQRPKPLKADDIERIHYAREVLTVRLSDPPSLMELARLAGINDCKLKAGFRQVFGTTVFGYLHNCRMERSRQLLDTGEMTVAEASQAVGYANRSHFAIAFRKKFGLNPGIYRRQQQPFG